MFVLVMAPLIEGACRQAGDAKMYRFREMIIPMAFVGKCCKYLFSMIYCLK